MKGRVLNLEAEMKVFEKWALNVNTSEKFTIDEVVRLESTLTLATAEREKGAQKEEKL